VERDRGHLGSGRNQDSFATVRQVKADARAVFSPLGVALSVRLPVDGAGAASYDLSNRLLSVSGCPYLAMTGTSTRAWRDQRARVTGCKPSCACPGEDHP
jgi:hypothetical protein